MTDRHLVPAQPDPRRRYFRLPDRVVWSDAQAGRLDGLDALLSSDLACCHLQGHADGGPSLVLDFGAEINGGVSIELAEPVGDWFAQVRLRFGESVSEVMHDPNNDHAIHDLTVPVCAFGKHEYGNTGFRFLRLDVVGATDPLKLRQVRAVALERPYTYRGSFTCSDPLLDDIWRVAARTVHLCCQEYILDGIKRDRLVWVGDIHPQVHVIAAAFGPEDIVADSLAYARDATAPGAWMNDHSSYSLWYLLSLWDWYFYTGETALLQDHAASLAATIDLVLAHVDDNGGEHLGGHRFLDWAIGYDEAPVGQGLHALTVRALDAAARMADVLNAAALAQRCRDVVARMRTVALAPALCKQAAALRVLAGLVDAAAADRDVLAVDPYAGLSPWYAYYVLEARAAADAHDACLEFIRTYWGGMLQLGATSFWEHFDPAWLDHAGRIDELVPPGKHDVHREYGDHCFQGLRHSLCHGWAGGPAAWLSRHVLGIRPAAPGCRQVVIDGRLGPLDHARGVFPTPHGPITVEHHRAADGRIVTDCQLPPGVERVTA